MPLPFMLLAVKAGAVMRTARPVLTEWNSLDPEAKRHLQREAADVRRSLLEVGRAVGGRLRDPNDKAITWEQARKLALNPRPQFLMARQVVEVILQERELEEKAIRSRLRKYESADLAAALAIAEKDGYIARCGRGRWQITEFADQMLTASDDIVFIEHAINDHIQRAGLAARDELALAVGSPDASAPEFLAALERALVEGTVEWLGPGLYGVSTHELASMQPPVPADAATAPKDKEFRTLLADLKRETSELRHAIARARAGESVHVADGGVRSAASHTPGPTRASPQGGGSTSAAPEKLRALKALLDDGVITKADFERKKSNLLGEL